MRWGRGLSDIAFSQPPKFSWGVARQFTPHISWLALWPFPSEPTVPFKKSLKNLWWSLSMSSTFSHHLLKFCRHHHEDFYGDGWYILHSRSFLPAQLGEVKEVSFMSFEYHFLFSFLSITPKYNTKILYESSIILTFFHFFLI